jgi:hypothetical protein
MNVYCINPVGSGFKVQVADQADRLRVVGIFSTEIDAEAWIAVDRGRCTPPAGDARREQVAAPA